MRRRDKIVGGVTHEQYSNAASRSRQSGSVTSPPRLGPGCKGYGEAAAAGRRRRRRRRAPNGSGPARRPPRRPTEVRGDSGHGHGKETLSASRRFGGRGESLRRSAAHCEAAQLCVRFAGLGPVAPLCAASVRVFNQSCIGVQAYWHTRISFCI